VSKHILIISWLTTLASSVCSDCPETFRDTVNLVKLHCKLQLSNDDNYALAA